MNLISAHTSIKQVAANQAATCSDAAVKQQLEMSSANSCSSVGGTNDQRALLQLSARNKIADGSSPMMEATNQSTTNLMRNHRPNICRFHQQQQQHKRPTSICANHQHAPMANQYQPKLVNESSSSSNHHLHHQHQRHVHHKSHCVHHSTNSQHQHHLHHDCSRLSADPHLKQFQQNRQQQPYEPQIVVMKRERHHHHHHHLDHEDADAGADRGRRRRIKETANSIDIGEAIELQHQHTSKRTTMRFISQLYFLIHLSAILSLLLHHKNLVTSESWRLQTLRQPLPPLASAQGKSTSGVSVFQPTGFSSRIKTD